MTYWLLRERGEPDHNRRRWLGPAAAGAIGGFIGGLLNTVLIVMAFDLDSLIRMGWLLPLSPNTAVNRLQTLNHLWQTKFGVFMPLRGISLGIGIALALCTICYGRRWLCFLNQQQAHAAVTEHTRGRWRNIAITVMRASVLGSWWIFLCVLLGDLLMWCWLTPGNGLNDDYKGTMQLAKTLGDGISLYTGAIGLISGTLTAILAFRLRGIGLSFASFRIVEEHGASE